MSEFRRAANRQRLWMVGLIAIVMLIAFFSENRPFFLGMLLGTVISYVNLLVLYRKATPLAESTETEGFSRGFGAVTRLVTAVLGAYIANRNGFHIGSYAVGLVFMYPVILLDFVLFNRK